MLPVCRTWSNRLKVLNVKVTSRSNCGRSTSSMPAPFHLSCVSITACVLTANSGECRV
jgi:hypothetical protein